MIILNGFFILHEIQLNLKINTGFVTAINVIEEHFLRRG